ncbi:autotransporter outer membrane beta-barrel domain-containing protein [Hoeflea prorocentri]|uniref:Autotransporter domain-containing protein n=1 Tax=Hoeflea prorocentri TaxID=1922333 RepID=A0A9X3UKR2_9HYPH|nr:autotransporter outer membrane beta-barrel domain-containing protein [Hoeflea prorocentri]MCY6382205.1 autotransporter domain-containing protein [Hoeflea prorocentri]MDA5400005.1 autotransporter domain-containing protein [Hoeflea prorocentri]
MITSRILTTTIFGSALFAATGSAYAQVPCVAGVNPGACTVAPGVTIPSELATFVDDASITNAGTVGDVITHGHNSPISNSGTIGSIGTFRGDVETRGDNSPVFNSGTINGDVINDGDHSAVTNFGIINGFIKLDGREAGVTNSGTINSSIFTSGELGTVTNFGIINDRIRTSGPNSGVTNFGMVDGLILTFERDSGVINFGMVDGNVDTRGRNSDVTNSGTINGNIQTSGRGSGVTNSGTINGRIQTFGRGSDIANSGTVNGPIFTESDLSTVTNSGTINGNVETAGQRGSIANSGRINGFVETGGQGGSITNSGFIEGGVFSIGDNGVINLLAGSVVLGGIELSGFGNRTLNVGNGLNLDSIVTGNPTVNANGAPLVVNGDQVIVIDPTGLATAHLWLDTISGAILNTVDDPFAGGGNSTGSTSFAFAKDGAGSSKAAVDGGARAWGSVFGGRRNQDGSGPTVDADLNYGGVIVGADTGLAGNTRFGAFLGGALTDFDIRFDTQDVDAGSVFGGLYVRHGWDESWIKLIVAGGWADHDVRRVVANNTAAGGLETATASYDGYFIIPSVTLGTQVHGVVPDHVLVPSVRVNYAGMFLDGYTESGVTSPLTISDRDVHLLGTRAQIALPYVRHTPDGARIRFVTRIGVDGSFNLGGDGVTGSVSGLPLSFDANFRDNIVSGFGGLGITRTSGDGVFSFTANAEGHYGSGGSTELFGNLKATMRF